MLTDGSQELSDSNESTYTSDLANTVHFDPGCPLPGSQQHPYDDEDYVDEHEYCEGAPLYVHPCISRHDFSSKYTLDFNCLQDDALAPNPVYGIDKFSFLPTEIQR